MKNAFLIMPFEPEFNEIWEFVLKPKICSLGHDIKRADNIFQVGSILEDILNLIKTSDYIIADVTKINANVYYELGYAHALGKKVILITKDLNTLPFDIKQQRVIQYKNTAKGSENLKEELEKFINNI